MPKVQIKGNFDRLDIRIDEITKDYPMEITEWENVSPMMLNWIIKQVNKLHKSLKEVKKLRK